MSTRSPTAISIYPPPPHQCPCPRPGTQSTSPRSITSVPSYLATNRPQGRRPATSGQSPQSVPWGSIPDSFILDGSCLACLGWENADLGFIMKELPIMIVHSYIFSRQSSAEVLQSGPMAASRRGTFQLRTGGVYTVHMVHIVSSVSNITDTYSMYRSHKQTLQIPLSNQFTISSMS